MYIMAVKNYWDGCLKGIETRLHSKTPILINESYPRKVTTSVKNTNPNTYLVHENLHIRNDLCFKLLQDRSETYVDPNALYSRHNWNPHEPYHDKDDDLIFLDVCFLVFKYGKHASQEKMCSSNSTTEKSSISVEK